MKRNQLAAIAVLAGLSGPVLAHSGLDEGSASLAALHALAHLINDHPMVPILLLGAVLAWAVTRAYERYHSARGQR